MFFKWKEEIKIKFNNNKASLRKIIQAIFLIVFFIMVIRGIAQLWILIFGAGLLISLLWGRFYCGWICPINTVIKMKNWIYDQLGIDTMQTPALLKKGWFRWVLLILLGVSLIISRRNNLQINLILYILGTAFIISLFFEEEVWHKYLCPYGVLLSITNKANSKKLIIDKNNCKTCGICAENCPNNIITIEKEKQNIGKNECLYCFKCQDVCEFNAISYQNINQI